MKTQKGSASVLVILFILLGIGLGVYVVGRSTHFLPFASEIGDYIFDEPYYQADFLDQEEETVAEEVEEETASDEDFGESIPTPSPTKTPTAKPTVTPATPKPVVVSATKTPQAPKQQTVELTPFQDNPLPSYIPFVRPTPTPKPQGGILGFFSKIFGSLFNIL